MNTKDFNKVIEDRLSLCKSVLCRKADEYATDDRLHNFKVAANLQGCTPEKALAGMMCKHTVSVYDLINDLENGKCATREMWDEKIGDSLNYLLLLTALLDERFPKHRKERECVPGPCVPEEALLGNCEGRNE